MPPSGRGMTQRAIWLGQQLAELRAAAGLTLQQAGDYLGRNPSSVSRFESGETPARIGDVVALMNLYGVDNAGQRASLEKLAREVWQRGWWERYQDNLSPTFIDLAWLESRASEIRSYEAMSLPGLLQTGAYAEAVVRAFRPTSDEFVRSAVDFRLKRQLVLDGDRPPRYHGIVDESALRRSVGGPLVMKAQLNHLLDMSDRDNIELRVLPLEAGAHAGMLGSFHVLTQPYPFAQVGYAETLAGSVYVEADDVEPFTAVYDHLLAASLDSHDSGELITQLESELG
jgi:transcriptional regulator with XRE-family HTH domain